MKKRFLFVLTSLLIIFGIVMIFKKDNTDNSKKIKVAEVTHSVFYTPFYVAKEKGYFKDAGIDIELMLVSGSDNVATSVLSGDTQIGLAGPESAAFVYLGGEKDFLQVFAGLTKKDGQFILRRDKKDFSWKDLEGKEILIGRSTGMPALSFMKALENEGIDKNKVKINTSIEFAELSGAFIGGNGDFVNLFEPLATKLEKENIGYVVKSVGSSSDEFPYTAFYAKKSFVDANKDTLKKFTIALKKGMDYTKSHDAKDIANVIKNEFSDTNIDDLEVFVERYKNAQVWLDNPYIEEEFYNRLINLLYDNKLINNKVYYEDLVNNLYE